MVKIINDHCLVNHDYIFKTLLAKYNSSASCDILVYNCTDPIKRSHFGYAASYETVKDLAIKLRPKVIIQLADEWASEQNQLHNLLSLTTNLFLRHHRHGEHLDSYQSNTYAIPLGYANGFDPLLSPQKMASRRWTWSFSGALRPNRQHMLVEFWRMWNNIVVGYGNQTPQEIQSLYNNSVFVPCGPGNSSLDCWRHYEASISGAIPVVCGSQQEILDTFSFFGELPPWIYADTWANAVTRCQEIQFDTHKQQEYQDNILAWWHRTIATIQDLISSALLKPVVPDLDRLAYLETITPKPRSVICYSGDGRANH